MTRKNASVLSASVVFLRLALVLTVCVLTIANHNICAQLRPGTSGTGSSLETIEGDIGASRVIPKEEPVFCGKRAFEFLVKQYEFGSRVPGSEAHEQCLYWMVDKLHGLAHDVTLQMFREKPVGYPEEVKMTNVIARFNPQAEKRILLGTHWDCRPWADMDPVRENRGKPVPGANDGASGVAVLLHLAELFRQQPPPLGVDIVLFDGEDSGLYDDPATWCLGSQEFARRMRRTTPGPRASSAAQVLPKFGIIVDMVGSKNLTIRRETNSIAAAPGLLDHIWAAASALGIKSFKSGNTGSIINDHVFLTAGGIPSVVLMDFEYGGEDNHLWHTLEDTPDNCSPQSLEDVGRVLVRVVYSGAGIL